MMLKLSRHLAGRLPVAACVIVLLVLSSCETSLEFNENSKHSSPVDHTGKFSNENPAASIGINVLLNVPINDTYLTELRVYGRIVDEITPINAVTMRIRREMLPTIQSLPFVDTANPDAERQGAPIDRVAVSNFTNGLNTWNLDAINVTEIGAGRVIPNDGSGVFIGVMDTGLLDSWRQYFPQERIATQYAKSFGGGGNNMGNVSEQPNKWEHDQNSHGTHVTSTILGFQLGGAQINGVAPMATVIPIKVLNQNGSGWSSVIARGIVYLADLKATELGDAPLVINMSLGGSILDAVEKAAIDYAISKGVIIVASAGNSGQRGMGYPGAYQPVISVASAGWKDGWSSPAWWYASNFPDPTSEGDLYISPFSARQRPGQDLDVIAPGSEIVGPYQLNSGQISYYFLSGTSMASPHVAGIVALMAQSKPDLTAALAETILENSAIPVGAGSRNVRRPNGTFTMVSWGSDATGHGFATADAALTELMLHF